jgi:quinol-cytochrome oxidoreductase complex cytochrome b subunit
MKTTRFAIDVDDNARVSPVRLVVVQGDERPAVEADDEPVVMTFPHLMIREAIALVSISLFLALLAILFDAPLEEIANPQKTPNPAKAPWYFLGLQELLHYYPPIVSGVLLPGLVVLALVVIPYFDINLRRRPFWDSSAPRSARLARLAGLVAVVTALSGVFFFTGSHPVWPILVPLWVVAAAMALPGLLASSRSRAVQMLAGTSLAFWIFFWFLLVSIVLTVIGTAFRGPGWEYTLPWRDGIY